MLQTKQISKNLFAAISAQVLSLTVSFIFGFIVPKFIDELAYSYWQMFLLYMGYVNIFQFGLLDGFILRYSSYDYKDLDKPRIRSLYYVLLFFTSIPAFITAAVSVLFVDDTNYRYVVLMIAIGIITKNVFYYTSYTFQSTNRITRYSLFVIIQRTVYVLFVVICLLLKVQNFCFYCLAEIAGDLVATLFGFLCGRELYIGKSMSLKETAHEAKDCIFAGVPLMFANVSSGLYIGSVKMITQWRWGEIVFGKISFAFSLYTVFLSFTIAISVVLFPSLKRLKDEELPELYRKIHTAISPILFFVLLIYFPMCYILERWLPNYASSLRYLGMLLPLMVFDAKISLLTNNYLKIYRKEGVMLGINTITLAFCFLGGIISAYWINNLDLLIIVLILACVARSIVSEIVVMKLIGQKNIGNFVVEIIMALSFVFFVRYLSLRWALIAYCCVFAIYAIINRKSIIVLFQSLKRCFHR